MKTIITALALMLTMSAFSQMEVSDYQKPTLIGEYSLFGKSYAEITERNGICVFTYRDEKFTQIDNYKMFGFRRSDLNTLYSLLTDFSGVEKGDQKVVDLENGEQLRIQYKKSFGKMIAEMYHISNAGTVGKVRYLTEKQLAVLFGKE